MPREPELPPPAPLPVGARFPDDGPLRPHHGNCFGCGPDNACGLHMPMVRDGDVVRTTLRLDHRHEGAPGFAHGGIVATILDDLSGELLIVLRRPAVTARLEVDYVAPVMLGRDLVCEAWVASIDGRKYRLVARLTDDGRTVAVSDGLFIAVGREHFEAGDPDRMTMLEDPVSGRTGGTADDPPPIVGT
ncbi:MAG: PaaI family thioesterase [Solirubrobacteraceae bacterium]